MPRDGDIVVGLDVGTTKVCAVIGERNANGGVDIIGIGMSPSHGLRKGVVVNIDSTVSCISKAIEEVELMSGVEVQSVYVGIAGGHLKGVNSTGVIGISNPNREITQSDVDRVIDQARAFAIPVDREVIHVLPRQFVIDGQDGIKEPVGMSGTRLEVEVHIVTGAVASAQNIVKSVNRAGFTVDDIVLEPLAASYGVLSDDEKELGVVLIDIGGGTTDIAVFVDGSIYHTEVLAIGGEFVTKDLSFGLRTPPSEAETIKIKHGCALSSLVKDDEMIEVPSVGGRKSRTIPRQVLVEIISPRMEEIFTLVNRHLKATQYENLTAAGAVLSGGTALIEGCAELAEKILDMPVRIGVPKNLGGLADEVNSPFFATAVGLVIYGLKHRQSGASGGRFGSEGTLFKGITNRMKEWFGEFFKY